MRRYGRFFMLLILLIAVTYFTLPILHSRTQAWIGRLQVSDVHTVSTTASTSIVYTVKPKQWLKFVLPEQSSHLRILTNAHITQADMTTQNPYWAYAMSYELLDKKNTVLAKGIYHQYSHVTVYKDAQGGFVNNNYYANKNIIPLDARGILLGMRTMGNAAFLRVSLETINPAVIEAAVRVYVPMKINEHELATSWQRLSLAEKENMAKNSIYPASLLSTEEKRNLLKHQWQAVGPMGIDGKSYQSSTLYTLKEKYVEQELQEIAKLAAGLQAAPEHHTHPRTGRTTCHYLKGIGRFGVDIAGGTYAAMVWPRQGTALATKNRLAYRQGQLGLQHRRWSACDPAVIARHR